MNRLQHETSPYLRQHADNPVDWYPWGQEALDRAKAEDKPILLSVGYSACHWCHVMAHESFEDERVAGLMNEFFINIKVDREERPDIDDIYMQAVQALSNGHGGWPMTVFLFPDGRPFYGGTYFPPQPRYGMPSFQQVLEGIHNTYHTRREECEEVARDLTSGLSRVALGIGSDEGLTTDLLDGTIARFERGFDSANGGYGGAPKFPQAMNLDFLLTHHANTGSDKALQMATFTLKKMAMGGIYDQIGGGFARYSVDAVWLVPHFEKMLYDNAQLSRAYLHAWQLTGDAFYKRIAEETYDYILREMTAPEGGFYSATDADSEGEEGKFFVWSKAEIESLLEPDESRIALAYFGVTERGNFEGHNILFVPAEDAVAASALGLSVEELREKLETIRHVLFAARSQRVPPGLDDKLLAGWNGLMLASLAEAARALNRADYRAGAIRAGEFLRDSMVTPEGRVWRTYNHGKAKINGFLEDYACLAEGFLQLYQTTFDASWFALALTLTEQALAHFRASDGGFYDTPNDSEQLIARPRQLQDNAIPSGSSVIAKVLVRLAAYTGRSDFDDAAQRTLGQLYAALREYPQAFGEALTAAEGLIRGLKEVAIIGAPGDADTKALLDVLQRSFRPDCIVALAESSTDAAHVIPLLHERPQRDGKPTAYVCRHFACQLPVTSADALAGQLAR
ncbi:MAG: thioredoxin domain-containing protein [Pleurocapsa minor GSE-CHR-MK-17-07R]|jgi:uncharacterized protein YyaL (SSP411 family)|nr:thioredoxin domain-containing protein [Pleurocapsa minor GSE-CHR-MK 17-07R]